MNLFSELDQIAKARGTARRVMISAHSKRVREAEKALPDYLDVLKTMKGFQIKNAAIDAVMLSEKSGLLIYFLAKFPDHAEVLNSLVDDERSLDREIGRLELLTEIYVEGKKPRLRVKLPSA